MFVISGVYYVMCTHHASAAFKRPLDELKCNWLHSKQMHISKDKKKKKQNKITHSTWAKVYLYKMDWEKNLKVSNSVELSEKKKSFCSTRTVEIIFCAP